MSDLREGRRVFLVFIAKGRLRGSSFQMDGVCVIRLPFLGSVFRDLRTQH